MTQKTRSLNIVLHLHDLQEQRISAWWVTGGGLFLMQTVVQWKQHRQVKHPQNNGDDSFPWLAINTLNQYPNQ